MTVALKSTGFVGLAIAGLQMEMAGGYMMNQDLNQGQDKKLCDTYWDETFLSADKMPESEQDIYLRIKFNGHAHCFHEDYIKGLEPTISKLFEDKYPEDGLLDCKDFEDPLSWTNDIPYRGRAEDSENESIRDWKTRMDKWRRNHPAFDDLLEGAKIEKNWLINTSKLSIPAGYVQREEVLKMLKGGDFIMSPPASPESKKLISGRQLTIFESRGEVVTNGPHCNAQEMISIYTITEIPDTVLKNWSCEKIDADEFDPEFYGKANVLLKIRHTDTKTVVYCFTHQMTPLFFDKTEVKLYDVGVHFTAGHADVIFPYKLPQNKETWKKQLLFEIEGSKKTHFHASALQPNPQPVQHFQLQENQQPVQHFQLQQNQQQQVRDVHLQGGRRSIWIRRFQPVPQIQHHYAQVEDSHTVYSRLIMGCKWCGICILLYVVLVCLFILIILLVTQGI